MQGYNPTSADGKGDPSSSGAKFQVYLSSGEFVQKGGLETQLKPVCKDSLAKGEIRSY